MQEVTSGDTAEVSKEIDVKHTPPESAMEEKGNKTAHCGRFSEPILNANLFSFE